MLKRIAIALAITVLTLALIDRASLFIAPCGAGGGGYSNQKTSDDDNCALREGIVIAGIEWLREKPPEVWTALATIAIAAFTLTLWLSNEKMWRITRRSVVISRQSARAAQRSTEIAERALIAGERAFISIFNQNADRDIRTGHITYWRFVVTWINAGNTPTRNMENHVNASWPEAQWQNDWDFPDCWVAAEPRIPAPLGAPPKRGC
jgi:hypothetical protein